MIYLAVPIKHDDPAVVKFRVGTANLIAARLHDAGIPVFSPASHSEAFIELCKVRQPWGYWSAVDLPILLRCCNFLAVIGLPGWRESVGVSAEIELAETDGKPWVIIDGDSLDLSEVIEWYNEVSS